MSSARERPVSPTKAHALAAELLRSIQSGRWRVGDRLPTERELAAAHHVGVGTVRRAVDLLVRRRLVERRQGSGTYVRGRGGGRRAGLVGVIVPSGAYYYPPVIDGAARALAEADVRMLLACSDYRPEVELAEARQLVRAGADGLLVAPTLFHAADPQAYLWQLRDLGVPFVLMERQTPGAAPDDPTEYVCSDIAAGAYTAVRHLAGLGRQRLAHLGRIGSATGDDVAAGFRSAVSELRLPLLDRAFDRREAWSTDELAGFARACARERVTGVLALGDREGAALIGQLRAAGLEVPRDVAIVSHDDEVADVAEVPLTAVCPPKADVGRMAVTVLLRRIALGPDAAPMRVTLRPTLTIRASCGAATASPDRGAGPVEEPEPTTDPVRPTGRSMR